MGWRRWQKQWPTPVVLSCGTVGGLAKAEDEDRGRRRERRCCTTPALHWPHSASAFTPALHHPQLSVRRLSVHTLPCCALSLPLSLLRPSARWSLRPATASDASDATSASPPADLLSAPLSSTPRRPCHPSSDDGQHALVHVAALLLPPSALCPLPSLSPLLHCSLLPSAVVYSRRVREARVLAR